MSIAPAPARFGLLPLWKKMGMWAENTNWGFSHLMLLNALSIGRVRNGPAILFVFFGNHQTPDHLAIADK
jgi:hypothetical protein